MRRGRLGVRSAAEGIYEFVCRRRRRRARELWRRRVNSGKGEKECSGGKKKKKKKGHRLDKIVFPKRGEN
jgi:hypothetical protein